MTTDIPKGPHITRLDGVNVGDTVTAKLTLSVLRGLTADGTDVQAALTKVASRCLCDEWTVYRWLRGQREPGSPKTAAALRGFAVEIDAAAA